MEPLIADITGYNISLWLHITAVVVGLGATAAAIFLVPLAVGSDPRSVPFAYEVQSRIFSYAANPALLVILATGIYQVLEYEWGFGKFWVSASFMIVILLGGLIGGYLIPTDRKLAATARDEIASAGDGQVTFSEEFQHRARVEGMMNNAVGFLIVIAIFLMVVKPGA